MRRLLPIVICCGLWLSVVGCSELQPAAPKDAFDANTRLGRGVNLGNALEAPREGDWGVTLEEDYFEVIRQAGFSSVRLPVRWSAHAQTEAPYTISEQFFARVDWAIEQALSRNLAVVLNMHHYEEIMVEPEAHLDRFLGMWQQIAAHYQAYPDTLYFEILNEPNSALSAPLWQSYFTQALAVIRETNPARIVIIGPANWNDISSLSQLKLPAEDRRLIVTFHYYKPFRFTHQGAEWVKGSRAWLETSWSGTDPQQNDIAAAFRRAARWAAEQDRPLYLGEFGAYSKADMDSRATWTAFVRSEAERQGMSWAYWEFGAGFGVYDRGQRRWREPLLMALIPATRNP